MIGKPRIASWFQTLTSVTASATAPPSKCQARSIANETANARRGAARRDVRGRRRRLRDDERLTQPKAGKRDHPRRRICGEVEHDGGCEGKNLRPRERLDDAPDVAVVRDPRQDEGEDADDDREREAAAQDRAPVLAARGRLGRDLLGDGGSSSSIEDNLIRCPPQREQLERESRQKEHLSREQSEGRLRGRPNGGHAHAATAKSGTHEQRRAPAVPPRRDEHAVPPPPHLAPRAR